MAKKRVLMGKTDVPIRTYRVNTARAINKTERAKTETLVALHGGKNISGASATTRKKRISKMLAYSKNLLQTIENVKKSRERATVSLKTARKKQAEANAIRKRVGHPTIVAKKRVVRK